MDLLNMEKLIEGAAIAEKITEGVVDDQAYNVITQTVNEDVLMEGKKEVETILENGKTINNKVNLDALESEVNSALVPEAPKAKVEAADAPKKEEAKVEAAVAPKTEEAKVEAVVAPKAEEAKVEAVVDPKEEAKVEATETPAVETPVEETPVVEAAETPVCECKGGPAKLAACECLEAKTEATNKTPAQPAVGVDTAQKFQDSVAVKQSEFVNANLEHTVSETDDKAKVDKEAEVALKDNQKEAHSNIKDGLAEKQNEVDVLKPGAKLENAEAYITFVESLKKDDNAPLIEAVLKAFTVICK